MTARRSKDADIAEALVAFPSWPVRIIDRCAGNRHTGWPKPDKRGYGRVRIPGTKSTALVHRVVWIAERGPIPPGHVLTQGPAGCGSLCCVEPSCWVCRPWMEA